VRPKRHLPCGAFSLTTEEAASFALPAGRAGTCQRAVGMGALAGRAKVRAETVAGDSWKAERREVKTGCTPRPVVCTWLNPERPHRTLQR